MTTEIKKDILIARGIDLEELGRMLGVPITVRPWWGSRRGAKRVWRSREISPRYRKWLCPVTRDYYSRTHPRVVGRKIVVYEGRCGVKWGVRTHKHRQWVDVVSVQRGAIVLEVFAGTDNYSHSGFYLLGVDGTRPYVAQVARVGSVEEAFEFLKPEEVLRAERQGVEVKRQGDWFFIPRVIPPKPGELEFSYEEVRHMRGQKALYAFTPQWPLPLRPTRHYAEEIIHSGYCRHVVRGRIASPDHGTLVLEGWHTAVRNRAIRERGNGGGGD